ADLPGRSSARYFEKTRFVAFGVQVDTVSDFAEQRAAHALFSEPISKIDHRVGFAPVFTIFPDLHWSTTDFLRHLDQTRIVFIATVGKEDLVVLRDQLALELVDSGVDLVCPVHVAKLMGD